MGKNPRNKVKLEEEFGLEIARIDAEIERLRAMREGVLRMKERLTSEKTSPEATPPPPRKRASNVKPLILDIMARAANVGATSVEVDECVKEKVPNVAKDTVPSTLSRLKADGALVYDGERYYDARFAPKADQAPFDRMLRVAN